MLAGGQVSVAAAGWPEATWAVAHARRLQLDQVRFADWTWTPDIGWQQDTGQDAGACSCSCRPRRSGAHGGVDALVGGGQRQPDVPLPAGP